jgi:hypothetical protein
MDDLEIQDHKDIRLAWSLKQRGARCKVDRLEADRIEQQKRRVSSERLLDSRRMLLERAVEKHRRRIESADSPAQLREVLCVLLHADHIHPLRWPALAIGARSNHFYHRETIGGFSGVCVVVATRARERIHYVDRWASQANLHRPRNEIVGEDRVLDPLPFANAMKVLPVPISVHLLTLRRKRRLGPASLTEISHSIWRTPDECATGIRAVTLALQARVFYVERVAAESQLFQVPRPLATKKHVVEAVREEVEYRLPYMPRPVLADAVAAHVEESGDRLAGRFARGIHVAEAETLAVSKPRIGFRPVAVLSLEERIAYRLVARPAAGLISGAGRSFESQQELESAPIDQSTQPVIVISDVADFYPTIDHGILEDELVAQTGDAESAHALGNFLGLVMGRGFGLPQVYESSNQLSEVVIDIVERRLLRRGIPTWRQNDDFRMTADSRAEAIAALVALDRELRDLGMSVNEAKTFALTRKAYVQLSAEPAELWEQFESDSSVSLHEFADYGDEGAEEEEHDDPQIVDAAVKALANFLTAPTSRVDHLKLRVQGQIIRAAFRALRLAQSSELLQFGPPAVTSKPYLTATVCEGLRELVPVDEDGVLQTLAEICGNRRTFLSEWQCLWIMEPLRHADGDIGKLGKWVRSTMEHTTSEVLRTRAALTLAVHGLISSEDLAAQYAVSEPGHRPELAAAMALVGSERVAQGLKRDSPFSEWAVEYAQAGLI